MARYTVWSVECWGHAPSDCCASYSCRCVVECPHCDGEGKHSDPCDGSCSKEGAPCNTCEGNGSYHDDNRCECGFEMNDRAKVGSVEFSDDATDSGVVSALVSAGFLKESVKESDLSIDDNGDGFIAVDAASTGEQLFQLEEATE